MSLNIQQLKLRYRSILQHNSDPSDESNSQDQDRNTLYEARHKQKILTQHCQNVSTSTSINKHQNSTLVIALKQRVAQGLRNLSLKQNQVDNLKKQIMQQEQKIILIQQQLSELKHNAQQDQKKIVQEKVNVSSLQKDIKHLQSIIEALNVQKQLIDKQNLFYKNQIASLKLNKKQSVKKMQSIEKQIKAAQTMKAQNLRLKQDIKRLQVVINECYQGKDSMNLRNKHFLGKPYRQRNYWFSENMIGQVQLFLKKQQVAQGNQQFLNNLVKFIDRYSKFSAKSSQKHTRQSSDKRSHYKSSSVYQMADSSIKTTQNIGLTQSTIKKSILTSKLKKLDCRKYNEYFMLHHKEKLDLSILQQIITEYQKILEQALQQKQIQPKKIMKLSQQMAANIQEAISRFYSQMQ